MSYCPRCVHPVVADASSCANCGYDTAPVTVATLTATDSALMEFAAAQQSGHPEEPAIQEPDDWEFPVEWAEQTDVIPSVHRVAPVGRPSLTQRVSAVRLPTFRWRPRLPVLVAALVAIAVVIVVAVVARPGQSVNIGLGGSGGPFQATAPKATQTQQSGQQQAAMIGGYLTQSAAARKGVSVAISAIESCKDIAGSVDTLSGAADTRAKIIAELAGAQVGALPGGDAMLADLRQALQASADADRHYAAWGTTAAVSCTGHAAHTADYSAAQQFDTDATAAKQRFIKSWNAVATQFGQTQQTASTF